MSSGETNLSALGLVYVYTTLSWVSYALVYVSLPFRFEELGLSVIQYGTAAAFVALGLLATESVWGALLHRIATRPMVLFLGFLVALIFLGVGVSHTLPAFALTLGLLGAMAIFPVPVLRWFALTAGGPGTGGRGTARLSVFSGTGIAVGSALGPVLFVTIGFFWLSVTAVVIWVCGTLVLALLPWAKLDVPVHSASVMGQVRRVFTKYFWVVAFLVTLYFVCYTLTSNFLQYYSVGLFGGTPADAGYVIGAMRVTGMISGVVLARFVDRWGPKRSAPMGFVVMAVGTLVTYFSGSYLEMVASSLVIAVGVGWLNADLLPLALAPVSKELQGATIGVFGSFEDLGQFVGPLLIGTVYATYGPTSIFILIAGVGLGAALICACFSPGFGVPPSDYRNGESTR